MKYLLLVALVASLIKPCFADSYEYIESCAGRHIEHKVIRIGGIFTTPSDKKINKLLDDGYKIQAYVGLGRFPRAVMVRCKK